MTGSGGTLGSTGNFRTTEGGDADDQRAPSGPASGQATVTVVPDTFPPTAAPPITALRRGATVDAGSVPLTISWAAADEIGTGVAAYELRRKLDGGAWVDVALPSPTSQSISQGVPPGRAVQYELRATDRAGNVGPWRTGSGFHLRLASERAASVAYTGRWSLGLVVGESRWRDQVGRRRG